VSQHYAPTLYILFSIFSKIASVNVIACTKHVQFWSLHTIMLLFSVKGYFQKQYIINLREVKSEIALYFLGNGRGINLGFVNNVAN